MTRHRISPLLPPLTAAALGAGLLVGCGGGSTGGALPAGTATTTAAATAPATTTRPATTTTPARPRSAQERAVAALATQVGTRPKHRFAAAPITRTAASRLARRGSIVVPVAVGGPGTVTGFGQALLPGKGIVHVADAAPRTIDRAGVVKLTFVLTPVARERLAAGRAIVMYVAVRFSKGAVIDRIPVRLEP